MADEIIVEELFDSREITTGKNPSAVFRYLVRGTIDEVEARAEVISATPAGYDLYGTGLLYLPRIGISFEPPLNNSTLRATVTYGSWSQTNQSEFSFDTGGGMHHMQYSLETVGRYAVSADGEQQVTAADCENAIGVTDDGVEGVDIVVPQYQFCETHFLPPSVVTESYKQTLGYLTGRVNNAPFRGYSAGEVLFCGAAGRRRGIGDWGVTFRFAMSPNITGKTIGRITGIDKKGWEYLWIRFRDVVRNQGGMSVLLKVPEAVYVERLYEYGNFAYMGLSSRFGTGDYAHSGPGSFFPLR